MVRVTDTAAAIARFRAAEAELPAEERLFEDSFARLFCGDPAASEAADRFLSAPFFHEHVRLRTRFIDDFVRTGLADGLRQIVALGVGFDCRALRLREIEQRGATVFEVDLASQLDAKRTILVEAGVAIPGFVRFVHCDFSAPEFERRLSDDLRRAGLDPKGGTLFVCEGLFGYLGDAEVDRSLRWMAATGGAGSRLIFNYSTIRFDPDRLAPRVADAGFAALEDEALAAVYRRYLPGAPPPGGEFYRIAVARV